MELTLFVNGINVPSKTSNSHTLHGKWISQEHLVNGGPNFVQVMDQLVLIFTINLQLPSVFASFY